jgi:hypothetical protein
MSGGFASLYKNRKRIVWVEDELTRAYLRALWAEPDIEFMVAGGKGSVEAVVKASIADGHQNVCGIVDRDFQKSNRKQWSNDMKWLNEKNSLRIFRTEAHEVECYVLDFDAFEAMGVHGYATPKPSSDWKQIAKDTAQTSVWWMAVRAVLWDVHLLATKDFPSHPKLGNPATLLTLQDAKSDLGDRVLTSPWMNSAGSLQQTITQKWLDDRLTGHADQLTLALNDGSWKSAWSGRELLKTRVLAALRQKSKVGESDIAKEVAEFQRGNGTIPEELEELRQYVRPE